MGIQDLNLDLRELAERMLIISDDLSAAERIGHVLEMRGYAWRAAQGIREAGRIAAAESFDMIIAEFDGKDLAPLEALSKLTANPYLTRSFVLLLHPKADTVSPETLHGSKFPVTFMRSPWEPSGLLINVSAQLRQRKIRDNETRSLSNLAVQNIELRDLTNRFKLELLEAQNIQNSIMPKSLPSARNTLFAAAYVPLEAVGGDIYDLWQINEDLFGLFIGDVTGHGLSAAFIGAMTKMALSYAPKTSPELMLAEMNRGLVALMPEGRFVTAAAAFYRPSSGELLVARAGHPAGYLFRNADRSIQEVTPKGLPLGVVENVGYELFSTKLEASDKFLFVTDGLTEAVNMEGRTLGTSGMGRIFCQSATDANIAKALEEILLRHETYSDGRTIKDDITLIGLEKVS